MTYKFKKGDILIHIKLKELVEVLENDNSFIEGAYCLKSIKSGNTFIRSSDYVEKSCKLVGPGGQVLYKSKGKHE